MQTQIHKESLFMTLGIMPVPENWYRPVNEIQNVLSKKSERDRAEYLLQRKQLSHPIQEKKCIACGCSIFKLKTNSKKQWADKKYCSVVCSRQFQLRRGNVIGK